MSYTIKNLSEHGSANSDEVGYIADLISEKGECMSVKMSESSSTKCIIVYNRDNGDIYPIEGGIKPLAEYRNGDVISLGECIKEDK